MSSESAIRSDDTMSPAMADAHAYHEWVFSSFADHFRGGTALEIGSGHGRYARMLADLVDRVIVSDIDPEAVVRIERDLCELRNIEFRVMAGVNAEVLGTTVDHVVLVNVLEHIDDDIGVLRAARAVMNPGGRLAVFVPAFPALYARMDAEAGHVRRYSRRALLQTVRSSGFNVLEVRYFNAVGFVGWFVNKLARSSLHGAGTNTQIRVFDRLVPLFRTIDRLVPSVGQSLVVVATPC